MQELKLRRETYMEQFAQTRLELQDVIAALVADASVPVWEQRLTETSEKIERLGAVNLAAIEEFAEQTERKEYLDRQFAERRTLHRENASQGKREHRDKVRAERSERFVNHHRGQ